MASTLHTVRHSITGFGRTAGKKFDRARDQTGGALHAAASSMRKSSSKIERVTTSAARCIDQTASFIEDTNFKHAVAELRRYGQKHMTCSLLVSAAVGIWAGFTLGRVARS